jgi:hypothetical protein
VSLHLRVEMSCFMQSCKVVIPHVELHWVGRKFVTTSVNLTQKGATISAGGADCIATGDGYDS